MKEIILVILMVAVVILFGYIWTKDYVPHDRRVDVKAPVENKGYTVEKDGRAYWASDLKTLREMLKDR